MSADPCEGPREDPLQPSPTPAASAPPGPSLAARASSFLDRVRALRGQLEQLRLRRRAPQGSGKALFVEFFAGKSKLSQHGGPRLVRGGGREGHQGQAPRVARTGPPPAVALGAAVRDVLAGAPPVRGHPSPVRRCAEDVVIASKLTEVVAEIGEWAAGVLGADFTIEDSARSLIWKTPAFQRLSRLGWRTVTFEACAYWAEYRKATALLCAPACQPDLRERCRWVPKSARFSCGHMEEGGVRRMRPQEQRPSTPTVLWRPGVAARAGHVDVVRPPRPLGAGQPRPQPSA